MDWLNYHHLYYFWTVARTGSVTKASAELLLAPPTVSAQIKRLEVTLGEKLFERSGRGDLATQGMALVLPDSPMGPTMRVRAFNHLLGECGVAIYGERRLAARFRRGFPGSLDGAPFLLPTESASLRAELDQWFQSHAVRPRIVGEFDDFSLLRTFAEKGLGLFASPLVLDREMRRYHLVRVGRVQGVRARFYGISVEKRLKNPAVVAICETARQHLFA